jgi:hypothetical protein
VRTLSFKDVSENCLRGVLGTALRVWIFTGKMTRTEPLTDLPRVRSRKDTTIAAHGVDGQFRRYFLAEAAESKVSQAEFSLNALAAT